MPFSRVSVECKSSPVAHFNSLREFKCWLAGACCMAAGFKYECLSLFSICSDSSVVVIAEPLRDSSGSGGIKWLI